MLNAGCKDTLPQELQKKNYSKKEKKTEQLGVFSIFTVFSQYFYVHQINLLTSLLSSRSSDYSNHSIQTLFLTSELRSNLTLLHSTFTIGE